MKVSEIALSAIYLGKQELKSVELNVHTLPILRPLFLGEVIRCAVVEVAK